MSVTSITLPSQFASGTYAPAFDPAGNNAANVVTGEQQLVAANFGSDVQFLVPSYAPFFATGVSVSITNNTTHVTTPLLAGTDYGFGFPFISATRATGLAVYGGIVLYNNQLAGTVNLSYHTLGGVWTNTVAFDQAENYLTGVDPYVTTWEQVTSYASVFPQVNGPWDKTDPTAMSDVIGAVLSMVGAINTSAQSQTTNFAAALAHIFSQTNPHGDTAAMLGLDQVANYPPATDQQASDFNNNASYISPHQLSLAFAAGIQHATDTVSGLVEFNDDSQGSDPTDSTRVLTAASFGTLVSTPGSAIYDAFNKGQREGSFSPYPFTFPKTWNGQVYNDMNTLLLAIQISVGVFTPLEFSTNQGKIWFPAGVTVPSLTLT